jgi:oxaloacetate decarboxylase beta subunit
MSVPLIGSLMFGNLIPSRRSGPLVRRRPKRVANIVTLLLGITIGSSMSADKFLNVTTLMILGMGLVAFIFDTAAASSSRSC